MSEEELIEVKPEFMGFHAGKYPGAFPPKVEERIRKVVGSPCLHLFSGSSKIGDERIDLTHPNATRNTDVFEFIRTDSRYWEWVVLDPPYQIDRADLKLKGYGSTVAVSSSVPLRQAIERFLQEHAANVMWFDLCSPRPDGFDRQKTWLFVPGGYRAVRTLTWLKRKGERLA